MVLPNMAFARTTDPQTSHAAARTVKVRESQAKVFALLAQLGSATHDELIEYANNTRVGMSPSGVRSRCHELVVAGMVVDTGQRRVLPSGRSAVVWAVKKGAVAA